MNLKKHVLSVLLLVSVPICAIAQNVTVKGQVKDDAGEPLILVNVLQLGTSNGTELTWMVTTPFQYRQTQPSSSHSWATRLRK